MCIVLKLKRLLFTDVVQLSSLCGKLLEPEPVFSWCAHGCTLVYFILALTKPEK